MEKNILSKLSINRKNIPSLLTLIILLIGIVAGVYLVGHRTNLFPKAGGLAQSVPETSFTLSAPSNAGIGEEIRVQLSVRSDIEAVNLFTAKLKFPADLLMVTSFAH